MKTYKYIFTILTATVLVSCNDSFLDRYPKDELTDKNFWQTEEHLKSVANTFTSSLEGKDWLNKTEILADSAPWAVTSAYRQLGGGNYTKELSQLNSFWVRAYRAIGRTNYFLNNYNRAVNVPEKVRERYAAEAYFYRAYNYWRLTTWFGDVPLVTDELNVESPDVYRGRDKRADVIDRVTTDLENHYKNLPEYIPAASAEFGRVSQCAALALLSRIYLYNEMWEKAADAAMLVMKNSYHELYQTGHPESDYCDLFTYKGRASRNAANKEVILAYIYNYELGESARSSHNLSRECWVNNDYARFVPTKAMVESYLTDEGKIWDPSAVTSYEGIFEHRDPRMKQSILAPGTPWEGGKCGDLNSTDDKIFTYPKLINDKTGCMTYTGYYMRKYVEPSTVKYVGHDDNDIIFIRLGEVLLNYAEARCKMGALTQADLDMSVNKLRDRVGMVHLRLDNIPEGSSIEAEIQRERRVELFAEGHRYFDIRRWRQGDLLAQPLLGVCKDWIDPARVSKDSDFLDKFTWKNVDGKEYLLLEDGRRFEEKHYLFPVPFTQTQLNPNLNPNNEGW